MLACKVDFPDLVVEDIERVVEALSHYEEHTCLRFRERTDEQDYIEFEKGLGYAD